MVTVQLLAAVLWGLAAGAIAATIRSLPFWPEKWLAKKPLGCPLCMGFWTSIAVMVLSPVDAEAWVSLGIADILTQAFAVTAVASLVNRLIVPVPVVVFDIDAPHRGE